MTPERMRQLLDLYHCDELPCCYPPCACAQNIEDAISQAVAAERERCARIADDWASNYERKDSDAAIIAAAIRARRDG
jgi:hypothetical protein